MRNRVLTQEQVNEGISLKKIGYSKRYIARYFEVGETTVWENIFHPELKRHRKQNYKPRKKDTRPRCSKCEIIVSKVNDGTLPCNYQILDICLSCYLRSLREQGIDIDYERLLDY